jgi:hypothetical protein
VHPEDDGFGDGRGGAPRRLRRGVDGNGIDDPRRDVVDDHRVLDGLLDCDRNGDGGVLLAGVQHHFILLVG